MVYLNENNVKRLDSVPYYTGYLNFILVTLSLMKKTWKSIKNAKGLIKSEINQNYLVYIGHIKNYLLKFFSFNLL